jgi:signal transduction histidine kinase/ligand-binding sensor domain-containing protein
MPTGTMSQRGVVWAVALLLIAVCGRPPMAAGQEPVIDAPALADWKFQAFAANAGGAHPLAQLPDGTLVVGTESGLVQFDGRRMNALPLAAGVAVVKLLLVDRAGTLHVVCADAAHLGISANDQWTFTSAAAVPTGEGDKGREPTSICEGADGAVWIGHRDGLVSRTVGRAVTWIPTATAATTSSDASAQVAADIEGRVWMARKGCLAVWSDGKWNSHHELASGQLRLAAAREGGLWVGAGGTLFRFDEAHGMRRIFSADVPTVRELCEDAEGRLWMATSRYGLIVWDGSRLATAATTGRSIFSVITDREGGLWAGTTAGIERGMPRIVRRVEMPTVKPLRAVRTAAAGDLWFITLDGELGCQRPDDATFPSRLAGWNHGVVTAIDTAADGTLWLGTHDGGIVRIPEADLARAENLSVPPDLRGRPVAAIVATAGGLWAAIGPHLLYTDGDRWLQSAWPAGMTVGAITLLAGDDAGQVWAATAAGDILFARGIAGAGAADRKEELALERRTPAGFPDNAAIAAISPRADGAVWIATRQHGLWRWRDGQAARLGTEHGLPSATLLAAMPDDRGRLWCAGSRLFFTASLAELESVADGSSTWCHCWVTSGENELAFFDPAIVPPGIAARDSQGRVLVVLPTGLAVCEPDRMPADGTSPIVDVRGVRADGRPLTPAKPHGWGLPSAGLAQVPANTRLVEISLAERTLEVPSNARLQHRLDGIDGGWIDTPADRVVAYERLPAGRHALRLRSSTETSVWENSPGRAVIDVEPRLWERAWFRMAVVLGAAALAGSAAFAWQSWRSGQRIARLRQAAALDRERMRIARDMHDDVGTSLTQISLLAALVRSRTTAEAAAHLDEVTSIARAAVTSFDEIVWAVNPTHDTLPHLLSYVALQASQTLGGLGIECTIDAPEQVDPRPAMADFRRTVLLVVKEAIGNVIRHAGAKHVVLTMRIADDRLRIAVADDGCGLAAAAHSGRPRAAAGLDNMRRRAAELGGECIVAARECGGTVVTLDVPLSPHG